MIDPENLPISKFFQEIDNSERATLHYCNRSSSTISKHFMKYNGGIEKENNPPQGLSRSPQINGIKLTSYASEQKESS